MFDMPVTFIMELTYMMGRRKKILFPQELKTIRKNIAGTLEKKQHNAQYRVLTLKRETVSLFHEIFTNRKHCTEPCGFL